jgi:hypothetical protein
MDINDFDSCQRITVDDTVYIVLSIPVPNIALCVREFDVTGGASYVATVIVGMP